MTQIHERLAELGGKPIAGTPEDCIAAIEEYRAAGCTHVMLELWGDDRAEQIRLFGNGPSRVARGLREVAHGASGTNMYPSPRIVLMKSCSRPESRSFLRSRMTLMSISRPSSSDM